MLLKSEVEQEMNQSVKSVEYKALWLEAEQRGIFMLLLMLLFLQKPIPEVHF